MQVFVASVHHTGTQFTQKLFTDLDYEITDKTPKEAGNSRNYFHRCHISDSVMTELKLWLQLGIPIIVPLRHPPVVAESWLARAKPMAEMLRQWQILIDVVDLYEPLYLPLDSPNRDSYFTNLRLKTDLKLKTDWAVTAHDGELKPLYLTFEQQQQLGPLVFNEFFDRFYPPKAEVPHGT